MAVQTAVIILETIECANCHLVFGLTSVTIADLRKSGKTFYCPSGHSQWFGESEASKLQRALDSSRSTIEYYRNQAQANAMQLRAKKGQVTKLKNKIAAGTCPCCSQEFTNLKKHMENEHPDFAAVEKSGNEN